MILLFLFELTLSLVSLLLLPLRGVVLSLVDLRLLSLIGLRLLSLIDLRRPLGVRIVLLDFLSLLDLLLLNPLAFLVLFQPQILKLLLMLFV